MPLTLSVFRWCRWPFAKTKKVKERRGSSRQTTQTRSKQQALDEVVHLGSRLHSPRCALQCLVDPKRMYRYRTFIPIRFAMDIYMRSEAPIGSQEMLAWRLLNTSSKPWATRTNKCVPSELSQIKHIGIDPLNAQTNHAFPKRRPSCVDATIWGRCFGLGE